MPITRLVVVDPDPPPAATDDVLTYQVPGNSRAYELLIQLFEEAGIDFVEVEIPRRKPRRKEGKT